MVAQGTQIICCPVNRRLCVCSSLLIRKRCHDQLRTSAAAVPPGWCLSMCAEEGSNDHRGDGRREIIQPLYGGAGNNCCCFFEFGVFSLLFLAFLMRQSNGGASTRHATSFAFFACFLSFRPPSWRCVVQVSMVHVPGNDGSRRKGHALPYEGGSFCATSSLLKSAFSLNLLRGGPTQPWQHACCPASLRSQPACCH